MNRFLCAMTFGLILAPSFAMAADSFKCVSPDGKVTYSGQVSLVPGVKCEKMFVRKVPVPAEAAPAPKAATEVSSENVSAAADQAAKPIEKSAAEKVLDAKRKQAGAEDAKKAAEESKKKAAQENENKLAEQKMKEENCQSAKNNLRSYTHGGRISRIDEKGEKVYLEEAEIKQKADAAQKDIDKWCST